MDENQIPDFELLGNIKANFKKEKDKDRRGSLFQEFDPFFKENSKITETRRSIDSLNLDVSNPSINSGIPRKIKKWDNEAFLIESTPLRPIQIQQSFSNDNICEISQPFNKDIIGDIPLQDISSQPMSPISKSSSSFVSSMMTNSVKRFKCASNNSVEDESTNVSTNLSNVESNIIAPGRGLNISYDKTIVPSTQAQLVSTGGTNILIPIQTNPSIYSSAIVSSKFDTTNQLPSKNMSLNVGEESEYQVNDLEKQNLHLRNLIVLYEEIIGQFEPYIDDLKNQHVKEIKILQDEKIRLNDDQKAIESSFSDLHRRYERIKQILLDQTSNETKLVQSNNEFREGLKLAGTKINEIMEENEKIKINYDQEIERLQATLKVEQIKISGLERNIQELVVQKVELTKICEELLSKA